MGQGIGQRICQNLVIQFQKMTFSKLIGLARRRGYHTVIGNWHFVVTRAKSFESLHSSVLQSRYVLISEMLKMASGGYDGWGGQKFVSSSVLSSITEKFKFQN